MNFDVQQRRRVSANESKALLKHISQPLSASPTQTVFLQDLSRSRFPINQQEASGGVWAANPSIRGTNVSPQLQEEEGQNPTVMLQPLSAVELRFWFWFWSQEGKHFKDLKV